MIIEQKQVTQLVIKDVPRLDPVTVTLEDFEPGRGKVTIECFGKAWSGFWGAMGKDSTVADFLCAVSVDYIIDKIATLESSIFNPEGIKEYVQKEVIRERRTLLIGKDEARARWQEIDMECVFDSVDANAALLSKVFGAEWWYSLPMKPNPDYLYLKRIVCTVREALQSLKEEATA